MQQFPVLIGSSEERYHAGYNWCLGVFLAPGARPGEGPHLAACLHATRPAFGCCCCLSPAEAEADLWVAAEDTAGTAAACEEPGNDGDSSLVGADFKLSVYDHELEQWG